MTKPSAENQQLAYSAGHFEVTIAGVRTLYVKSVDGGWPKQDLVDDPTGASGTRIQSGGKWDIDPITLDLGLSGTKEILKWIQSSWRNDPSERDGEIVHANFDKKKTLSHEFRGALIQETTFPTLDGSSRESAFLKVKIQPHLVITKRETGAIDSGNTTGKMQKSWNSSHFRLRIDGLDELKVNKIESFTIKQTINKYWVGVDKYPTLTPMNIKFPTLVCTTAEAYAGQIHDWFNTNAKNGYAGKTEKDVQKSGSLEFLSSTGNVLFRIILKKMKIIKYSVVASTANEEKVKRAKFELAVSEMDLDDNDTLGLA